jgi:peptide/nickel transport system substrate-binding protein
VLGFKDRDKDGWRETAEGLPLRFSLKVASSESLHLRAAQVVARQLKAVGIAVRVEAIDSGRHRALLADRQFDLMIAEIGAHGLSDPDQFVESFRSGYLWRAGTPHPKLDALLEDWQKTRTPAQRLAASFALQRFHSQAPSTLVLYYPESYQAYRPKVYDRWRHVPGQGAMHKWSLLDLRYPVPGLTAP